MAQQTGRRDERMAAFLPLGAFRNRARRRRTFGFRARIAIEVLESRK